jgi:hypothetical protein
MKGGGVGRAEGRTGYLPFLFSRVVLGPLPLHKVPLRLLQAASCLSLFLSLFLFLLLVLLSYLHTLETSTT